jgi:hypothetical protein
MQNIFVRKLKELEEFLATLNNTIHSASLR